MTREGEASSVVGSARSRRQFLALLLPLAFVLPSTVIAVVCFVGEVFGLGPAAPNGWLGRPGAGGTFLTSVPTVLWALSWRIEWSHEPNALENRMVCGSVAAVLSVVVCAYVWVLTSLEGLGQALN